MKTSPVKVPVQLVDRFGRVHDYLRVSLTTACNMACSYCGPPQRLRPALATADLVWLLQFFVQECGIRKIRFTGGEPLLRKDLPDLLYAIHDLPIERALTTNGLLLDAYLDVLADTGFHSLNISLDTRRPERFFALTKVNGLTRVLRAIDQALQRGFHIKINMVVLRHFNDDEIVDFVRWTLQAPVHIRFIEFMPLGVNGWHQRHFVSAEEILQRIQAVYEVVALPVPPHSTAQPYQVQGAPGTFAIIASVSQPFCATCNRLRLTADGKLRNCLYARREYDLKPYIGRAGALRRLLQKAVQAKAFAQGGRTSYDDMPAMREIGG